MSTAFRTQTLRYAIAASFLIAAGVANAVLTIPDTPLISTKISKPLTMIVAAKDHKLFYEAYNDASDVDGDGVIDIRFKPGITYYGLFDSTLCYKHNGKDDNTGLFTPADTAGAANKCSGKLGRWSGNFLNYVTTSRVDALRKVLYGGYREVDTAAQTILRRAYIPQDAHSWGKEYNSETIDKYKISDYTPLAQPAAGKRHLFGSLTPNAGMNCATLDDCSGKLAPWISVVTGTSKRIWEWASTERPVLANGTHGGDRKNYSVRVEVCTSAFSGGCKKYKNGNFKPIGLLHDYGENDSMLFGLLTGSYDKNMSGGILRKVVSSFKDEVDQDNGVFTVNAKIVRSLNALRIRNFNNGLTDNSYRNGGGGSAWVTTRPMTEGEFQDWGNPLGEMMYEALRYFSGAKSATPAFTFTTTGSTDEHVGLPFATWDDPYDTKTSAAKALYCAKPNLLAISDINPSFDSNQLPGSAFSPFNSSSLGSLNVKNVADKITAGESGVTGEHFIAQNCALDACYDGAPTAKNITSLGSIRGLAPEEPTKQGSYYSASVAHYGKTTDLRPDLKDSQTADTYAVALTSPLPRIEVTLSGGKITLVPFAKSVSGMSVDYTAAFQPTDQIVDYYVETIANSTGANGPDADKAINDGRYYAKFRINFEDVEQGADHDMDAISEYEIYEDVQGKLKVKVTPTYQAGGIRQNMGYIISGSTKDGVYLVVQDENVDTPYRLNTPPGRDPGYCNIAVPPNDCKKLPYIGSGTISDRTFSVGGSAATLLRDPLWYAAKWGGYVENNDAKKNDKPDDETEWDSDKNGVPDTYFLVQNPLKLKESLNKSFDTIVKRSASAGNITSNGQQLVDGSKIFQTTYDSTKWDGDVIAWEVTAKGVQAKKWWASQTIFDAATAGTRKFLSWNTNSKAGLLFGADINANWSAISPAQQALLGTKDVLSYVLGDQSNEVQKGKVYRNRSILLGDIVHSSPYFVKDSAAPAVYAGANDGMLHAFNGDTGKELFAYIPGLVYAKLSELTSTSYAHKFFVDGDVAVTSRSQTPGKNYLVGSLGRGGPGIFGLDVTDPTAMTASKVLWEYSAPLNSDADFGYILGRPQLGLLNNGVVAAVLGNGYNSTNGSAVLYVINIETGDVIQKIDTLITGDNGLATPRLWDADNDGKADYVYAGDLKGNVWKFDLSSANPNSWKLDSTTPLFVAKDSSDTPQPITAQILVAKNTLKDDPNIGKTFLFFGTGSYYFSNDPSNQSIQSWYGIIDAGTSISGRSSLTIRKIDAQGELTIPATKDTDGNIITQEEIKKVRVFSDAVTSPNDMEGKMGWYLDLFFNTATGERIVSSSQLISAVEPTLLVSSIIPTTDDPCEPSGGGLINSVNAFTGGALKDVFLDVNGDGSFTDADKFNGHYVGGVDMGVKMPGEGVKVGDQLIVGGSDGGKPKNIKLNLGGKTTGRVSWREIRLQ